MLSKNKFAKKVARGTVATIAALSMAVSFGALAGCGSSSSSSDEESASSDGTQSAIEQLGYSSWDEVVEAADGATVVYQGYDGNEQLNAWVNDDLTPALKEKYNITLKYQNDDGAMTALTDALAAGSTENDSTWDVTWTNGTGFKDVQEQGGWFGPICDSLPNYTSYVDSSNPLVTTDFAYDNQGYEAPFGFYELNIIKNDKAAPGEITSLDDIMALAKKYPGKFTYPSSDNWVGAAFIRTVIMNTCDYDKLMTIDASDTDAIVEVIQPALDWLAEINPYLWKEGKTFPADNDEMTKLFKSGEIYNDVLYDQYGCGTKINDGEYTEDAHSYILPKTTANMSYWAIPYNSANKAAAMVVINEMMSPEQQAKKSARSAGDVLDHSKLSDDEEALFTDIDHGPNNQTDEALTEAATSEYSADVETAITAIWKDKVVGK